MEREEILAEELAKGLLNLGYKKGAHHLQRIDRLLYHNEEISDGSDSEETLERLTNTLKYWFDAITRANELTKKQA